MLGGTNAHKLTVFGDAQVRKHKTTSPLLPPVYLLALCWGETGQGLSLSLARAWIPGAERGLQRCWGRGHDLSLRPH